MTEVREIHEDELERWIGAARAALDEADTVEGYLDWKRQARETIWLLASDAGRDVGTAIGVGGWHSPEGVARGEVRVVGAERGRGVGSTLLAELSHWARGLGYRELMGPVKEIDAESLAWTERRGFVEVGRNSMLVLDLRAIEGGEDKAVSDPLIADEGAALDRVARQAVSPDSCRTASIVRP